MYVNLIIINVLCLLSFVVLFIFSCSFASVSYRKIFRDFCIPLREKKQIQDRFRPTLSQCGSIKEAEDNVDPTSRRISTGNTSNSGKHSSLSSERQSTFCILLLIVCHHRMLPYSRTNDQWTNLQNILRFSSVFRTL